MTDELALLESHISRILTNSLREPERWSNAPAMEKVLSSVRQVFDSPVTIVPGNRVAEAVASFSVTGKIPDFISFRDICLGVGDIRNNWCILCDPVLRERVSSHFLEGNLRQQLKSFHALLQSYLRFPRDAEETPAAAVEGWKAFRAWLLRSFRVLNDEISQSPSCYVPEWFKTLRSHPNLLTDNPCEAYGKNLLEGDIRALQEARVGLAIPQESWVFDEAILAQVNYVVGLAGPAFRQSLNRVLGVVHGKTDWKVARRLTIRCVARLVSRYARCSDRPENIALRDAAITSLGNPWLHRQAWDAYVIDEAKKPDVDAREMVLGWLRRRLIKDFFELLTEDRAAEERRLNYWLRFEPAIDDLWFVLGSQIAQKRDADYLEFRKRAQGRVRLLGGQTTSENNAFVMRIGEYVAVEFGKIGNACRVRDWSKLPKNLTNKLIKGTDGLEIEIYDLRGHDDTERLVHQDSPSIRQSWEEKFDEAIVLKVGFKPESPPYSLSDRVGVRRKGPLAGEEGRTNKVEFRPQPSRHDGEKPSQRAAPEVEDIGKLLGTHKYKVEDNRSKGGAYWVLVEHGDSAFLTKLRAAGFRYKLGKGWWKE
jgi:EH_Signature domain